MSNPKPAEIHQHSGWLVPLGIFLVILALSGMFLLYDLRPLSATFRDNGPTAATDNIAFSVRGVKLLMPANYLETRRPRDGSDLDAVALFALLPDLRGYTPAEAALFAGNAADSPLLHLRLQSDTDNLDPANRLARIYMPYIADAKGAAGLFGLTRYEFRAGSGYDHEDLFVGAGDPMLLLLCERPAQDLPSPNCYAIDRPIAPNVTLSYRFKRAQLARWRQIGDGVGKLVAGFLRRP